MFRLLRPRRLMVLGIGFLLGSRAGRGPWEKAVTLFGEVQNKAQAKLAGNGSGGVNGMTPDLRDTSGVMTEI